ncbi:MAG: DMT family transporter [Pseudomonadota bacterium]
MAKASRPGTLPVEPARPFNNRAMRTRAFGSVAIAIAILTLMDAGVKHWTATFGTPQIIFMRYTAGFLVGAIIVVALLALRRVTLPSRASLVRAGQRALMVSCVAGLFFYSLSVIPLAEATAIAFTAPIYIALLGWIVLKEPVAPQTWIAIVIGLSGVVVISSGAFQGGEAFSGALSGYIVSALASMFYAGYLVLTRLHAASDPVPMMITLQSGFASLFALVFVVLAGFGVLLDGRALVAPDPGDITFALALGFLGTVGHLFMTWGFKNAPAADLGPMEYTSLFWAALYGFFLFDETPGWRLFVGCGLIVAGTWIVIRGER